MARKTTQAKKPTLEAKPETEDAVIEAADVETSAEEVEAIEPAPEAPEEPSEETVGAIEPEATSAETQLPIQQTTVVRKGGFVPMVLGGVVAAGIGFGSALYLLPNLPAAWLPSQGEDPTEALAQKLEAQSQEIATMKAELADAGANEALEARVADVSGQVSGLAGEIAALKAPVEAIAELAVRLDALEKAPVANASPVAVEAYQREMDELRAEIGAMTAEAEAKRASAEMTAHEALRRSAMSQILTSLETGSGFAEAIESLRATGVNVPEALVAQAAGVPTVAGLSADFPEAAREALAAARTAEGSESGGFGAFLKSQLGARSLEPREGTDPDAVLSRMEDAAREGRLGDVMAEAEGLPEEAQAPLQDWLDSAKALQAATEAAEALNQTMNTN